jgi:hypothetical protein
MGGLLTSAAEQYAQVVAQRFGLLAIIVSLKARPAYTLDFMLFMTPEPKRKLAPGTRFLAPI